MEAINSSMESLIVVEMQLLENIQSEISLSLSEFKLLILYRRIMLNPYVIKYKRQ